MEEQTHESIQSQTVPSAQDQPWFLSGWVVRSAFVSLLAAELFAILGVLLGSFHFTNAALVYPSWLLALWLFGDVLLVAVICVHILLLGIYAGEHAPSSDEAPAVGFSAVGLGVVSIGGWVLLVNRHFAWVSVASLAVLVVIFLFEMSIWQTEGKKYRTTSVQEQ